MGYARRVKGNRNVQTVRRRLADGTVALYRYHRVTRDCIRSEPGTPAFEAEMAAIEKRRKVRPRETVYFVQATQLGLIKIGIANDLKARIRAMKTASPDQLVLLAVIEHGGRTLEAELHKRFAAHREHGEWFRPAPDLMVLIAGLQPAS